MILLFTHILFALSSLSLMVAACIIKFRRSGSNHTLFAQLSAAAFAGLLGTGTALVLRTHAPLMGACLEGLLYLGALAAVYAVYHRLATKA